MNIILLILYCVFIHLPAAIVVTIKVNEEWRPGYTTSNLILVFIPALIIMVVVAPVFIMASLFAKIIDA